MSYDKNKEQKFDLKGTDMDDYLKELAVTKFKEAMDYSITGNDIACFKCYKSLFHLIEAYEFEGKDQLREITEIITHFIKGLGGKPLNKAQLIQVSKDRYTLRDLLQKYMSMIPIAYSELGLWFKVYQFHHDTDKYISKQFFNDDITLLSKKKKELLDVPTEQLIELMRPSHVHHIHSAWLIENAK